MRRVGVVGLRHGRVELIGAVEGSLRRLVLLLLLLVLLLLLLVLLLLLLHARFNLLLLLLLLLGLQVHHQRIVVSRVQDVRW